MTDERFYQIMHFMEESSSQRSPMHVMAALRWCEAEACACLGCANRNRGLNEIGVTKAEWQAWWRRMLAEVLSS